MAIVVGIPLFIFLDWIPHLLKPQTLKALYIRRGEAGYTMVKQSFA